MTDSLSAQSRIATRLQAAFITRQDARREAASRIPEERRRTLEAADYDLEATITPEDTLRAAVICDARQADYQRRMSSLLAGRPQPGTEA